MPHFGVKIEAPALGNRPKTAPGRSLGALLPLGAGQARPLNARSGWWSRNVKKHKRGTSAPRKTPISEARKIAKIAAQEQNREIATWGNVPKNAAQNAAFIHGELDKRGIRA